MSSLLKGIKLAVLGGDARELVMIPELLKLGMEVQVVGLPLENNEAVKVCATPMEAVRGAAAVLLPMPGIDNEGRIRAPLSSEALWLTPEVMAEMSPRAPLFVGVARVRLREMALAFNHKVVEIAEIDELAIYNSIPSAEGAIQMAMEELPITIHGSKSFVLGFGRTGMTLARMLAALGANTFVAARKPRDMARIYEMGYHSLTYEQLSFLIGEAEIIFNTVPSLILTEEILSKVTPGALIIDLASAPGGTDFAAAQRFGLKAILAPGLPGKVAPKTAGLMLAMIIPQLLIQELRPKAARTPRP